MKQKKRNLIITCMTKSCSLSSLFLVDSLSEARLPSAIRASKFSIPAHSTDRSWQIGLMTSTDRCPGKAMEGSWVMAMRARAWIKEGK